MIRHLSSCLLVVVAMSATVDAADRFFFPAHVFAGPPVVYAAPVVTYQPAYVVPTSFVVQSYPVSTLTYSTQYYAPMVPTVSAYPVAAYPVAPVAVSSYYAPRPIVVAPAAYAVPVYYGRGFRHHHHGWTRIVY